MGTDDEAPLGVAPVRPVAEELVHRAAEAAFGRTAGCHRQDRPASPEEGQMAEQVLAVLRPHDHFVAAGRVALRPPGEVLPVRREVTGLGREQVDGRDVLGRRLQQRGRRGDVVDVGIGGPPAGGSKIDDPLEVDHDLPRVGEHVAVPQRRAVLEPLDDLEVDGTDRQVDLGLAGDVRVGIGPQQDVRAAVLEQPGVDLVAVAQRRQVPAVGGDEPDPRRRGRAVRRHPQVDADGRWREGTDLDAPADDRPVAIEIGESQLVVTEPKAGVGRRDEVDDRDVPVVPGHGTDPDPGPRSRAGAPSRAARRRTRHPWARSGAAAASSG